MSERHRVCEICGMRERHSREKLFFARFPLDENRCRMWVKAVGKEDLVYVPIEKLHDIRFVCENHFAKRDFTKSGTRLKRRAVPKLNLSAAPLSNSQVADFPLHVSKKISKGQMSMALDHTYAAPVASSSVQKHLDQAPVSTTAYTVQGQISVAFDHTYAAPAASSSVQKQLEQAPVSTTASAALGLVHTEPEITPTCRQISKAAAVSTTVSTASGLVQTDMAQITPTCRQLGQAAVISTTVSTASGSVHIEMETASRTSEQKVCSKGVKRKLDKDLDITPRKKKLMAQLKKTKYTLSSLKKSAKLIETISSPVLKELVTSAIKNQNRKPRGKRWSTKNKISALAIFKRSPKAYRYLQHVMPLPSTKTLQNILKKIPMEPGINSAVINILKKKANTVSEQDKYCVLTFDEMAVKRRLVYNEATDKVEGFVDYGGEYGRTGDLADHCLVFQLQGIRKKIKQPLAFYFTKGTVSSERLAVLIKENIKAVQSTGYRVLGTVCDQGPTNMGALSLLREWHNGGENYFIYNEEKIYNICDVPHLLKSIRNNFMKYGKIRMDNKIGQWRHILEVEKQNRDFLYMSKITLNHVMPKYRAKMKVKYAAQILSQTVAAILKLLSRGREHEGSSEEILQTASIVEDLNRLFDYTNGPSNPDDVKKGIRENVSSKTKHLSVWAEFRQKLETLKFFAYDGKEAKNIRCINGYIMTLKSFRDIWTDLKDKGFKYLNLRQLNQDALENLFGLIRQHSPTNKHPTCSSLMAALKTAIVSGMTAPHSRGANCERDYKNLLTDFHDLVFPENKACIETEDAVNEEELPEETSTPPSPPVLSLPEDSIEYVEIESDLSSIQQQPLVYVSGYIPSVVLKKYGECNFCKNCLSVSQPQDNPIYDLIKLKEWWQDKISLTYPSVELCRIVEVAVNIFEKEGVPSFYLENICQWTITIFQANCNTSWMCTEHSHYIMNDIFVRLSLLFIRRQCQKVNCNLALKEEDLSNANKKGEQYGASK